MISSEQLFKEKINLLMVTLPDHRNALENLKSTFEKAIEAEKQNTSFYWDKVMSGEKRYIRIPGMSDKMALCLSGEMVKIEPDTKVTMIGYIA